MENMIELNNVSKVFSTSEVETVALNHADLHTVMTDAISHYVSDVKNLDFPNEKEQY